MQGAVAEFEGDDVRAAVDTAHRENLTAVFPAVERLIRELPDRSAITADHCQLLGKRHNYIPIRDYGHYQESYHERLTTVPWHLFENGERKSIRDDSPVETVDSDPEKVNERLRDLGYKL